MASSNKHNKGKDEMKTIMQRLQSRVSLRRNNIRALEESVTDIKTRMAQLNRTIQEATDPDEFEAGVEEYMSLRQLSKQMRQVIQVVAKDQKLDKDLMNMMLYADNLSRFFEEEFADAP
jgi:tRNA uridine 5-carbamoylmethylation protein Kti12